MSISNRLASELQDIAKLHTDKTRSMLFIVKHNLTSGNWKTYVNCSRVMRSPPAKMTFVDTKVANHSLVKWAIASLALLEGVGIILDSRIRMLKAAADTQSSCQKQKLRASAALASCGKSPLGLVHRKRPQQVSRIHSYPHILPKFLWLAVAFFGVPTQMKN